MRRFLLPAALVLAASAAAFSLLIVRHDGSRVLANVPRMSAEEALSHREERYRAIDSIERILALPTRFARMEALYALAGRSGSPEVQDLIFQADAVADAAERRDFLLVLFARLTELDPPSALALSRTPRFAADPALERETWQRWAELDFEAALDHAARQDGVSRDRAAQALYAATDERGASGQIAERLDRQPDSGVHAARLDDLAHADPASAVAYVQALESPLQRRQAAAHLGRLLGRRGIDAALRWSPRFGDAGLARAFEEAAAQSAAEVDPDGTLRQLLAESTDAAGLARLAGAFRAVAETSADQALAWFELLPDARQRDHVGRAIAAQLARSDPLRALAWARDHDDSRQRALYNAVIGSVAESDPDLAMAAANELPDRGHRLSALMTVTGTVSESDPARAIVLLEALGEPDVLRMMAYRVFDSWARSDPDAALAWIQSSDLAGQRHLLLTAAHAIASNDVDAAIRMLPRLDEETARELRPQIAANLALQRSLADAESFIARYEGTPEYPMLVGGMVQGLAATDPAAAVTLLDRISSATHRELLSSMVFTHYARRSPREAADAAAALGDEGARVSAMRHVLQAWAQSDAAGAEQWVGNLSPGIERDNAIATMSAHWTELTSSRRGMLESIEDPMARRTAMHGVLFAIARQDRERAKRVLSGFDLPQEEKRHLAETLENIPEFPGVFLRAH